jgi:SagB-type dehydrogenase family enzyme
MQALKARQTLREFSPERLPLRVLSNLLWAGFGVNRPDSGKRTAPSALNAQEVDLYAATSEGLYLYRAQDHTLQLVLAEDIRPKTGPQPFVTNAPLSLIYVADLGRLAKAKPADRDRYALLDAGFIIQNVYLYCASEDLACVVHDLDREALAQTMKLGPEQKVILAHAIGFPKK